jgi:hypothetical protein
MQHHQCHVVLGVRACEVMCVESSIMSEERWATACVCGTHPICRFFAVVGIKKVADLHTRRTRVRGGWVGRSVDHG